MCVFSSWFRAKFVLNLFILDRKENLIAVKMGILSSQDEKNSVFGINISTMPFAGSAQNIKISGQIYNCTTINCLAC